MPSQLNNDGEIYRRLVMRDLEALGQVYDTYAPMVYGLALKVTTNGELAQEVTQQVFLDLWRRPERFHPGLDRLRLWLAERTHRLATKALQEAVACLRRKGRSDADDNSVDIDEAIQSVLKTEEVRAALAALPDDQRLAIRAAYYGGKTYREVAVEFGVAEDIVKARMHSGLRRMAESLHPDVVGQDPDLRP